MSRFFLDLKGLAWPLRDRILKGVLLLAFPDACCYDFNFATYILDQLFFHVFLIIFSPAKTVRPPRNEGR